MTRTAVSQIAVFLLKCWSKIMSLVTSSLFFTQKLVYVSVQLSGGCPRTFLTTLVYGNAYDIEKVPDVSAFT